MVVLPSADAGLVTWMSPIGRSTAALACYEGERAALYANLKLSGLREAPVHLAIFCDHATEAGAGLGRKTMPETLDYSVVAAVHTFWLCARAENLGVGWVSILDPRQVCRTLDVPAQWKLIAYLCVGRPQEDHLDPELERHDWQAHIAENDKLHREDRTVPRTPACEFAGISAICLYGSPDPRTLNRLGCAHAISAVLSR